MGAPKYLDYYPEAERLFIANGNVSETARVILDKYKIDTTFDYFRRALNKHLKSKGITAGAAPPTLDGIIEQRKEAQRINNLSSNQKQLIDRIQQLENELKLASGIATYKPKLFNINTGSTNRKNEATAIVQYSDWHVDEVVNPKTVNGLNTFNPEIAKARATRLFENTVKLTDTQRHDINIPHLVIQLGGDFIGGYIHEELQQTNSMSPLEGIFYSQDLLTSGLTFLLEHGKFKSITCVCNPGNHARLTKKMQYANGYSMNLETYLYHALNNTFRNEKGISFNIPESEIAYMEVYDKRLRFFHGQQLKFGGGIGGIGVPLHKLVHRWDESIKAFYNYFGHFHMYSNPTHNSQLNGALKGYDTYAFVHGMTFQPPVQSFSLMDAKRGITIKSKIFCE